MSKAHNASTWSCMVCGHERPDEIIGVRRVQIVGPDDLDADTTLTITVNVRYCTDRLECIEGAENAPAVLRTREIVNNQEADDEQRIR